MDRRGISVTFVALMLAVMMTSSTTATPGVGTMQMSPGSEDGQPDAETQHTLLLWKPQLSNCNSKFNNTDADSAEYGEESKGSGILMSRSPVEWIPVLNEDVILAVGEMMTCRVCMSTSMANGPMDKNLAAEIVKNLNVSLMKGNRVVAIKEYDTLVRVKIQSIWDACVTEDLLTWNGSQESLGVEFTMVKLKAWWLGFSAVKKQFLVYFTLTLTMQPIQCICNVPDSQPNRCR